MGDALGQWGANLVVLGGVAYTIGGLIYALRWPDPSPKVWWLAAWYHGRMLVLVCWLACVASVPPLISLYAAVGFWLP